MKSTGVAYFLWLIGVFGCLGFHRFYLDKYWTGILWIITGGFFGIGSLIDLFTLREQVLQYNTNQELKTLRVTTNELAKMTAHSMVQKNLEKEK